MPILEAMVAATHLVQQLQQEKKITRWALGGSVATMVWTEPYLTRDIDFFVTFTQTGSILDLSPVWDAARQLGYETTPKGILVEGIVVEVLSPSSAIIEEGLEHAVVADVLGTKVPVIPPEYLIAEAVHVGRTQDDYKLEKLHDQTTINMGLLENILRKYGLYDTWRKKWLALEAQKNASKTAAQKYLIEHKREMRQELASQTFEQKLRALDDLIADAAAFAEMRKARALRQNMENHITFFWADGTYISTLDADFRVAFSELVAEHGLPDQHDVRPGDYYGHPDYWQPYHAADGSPHFMPRLPAELEAAEPDLREQLRQAIRNDLLKRKVL